MQVVDSNGRLKVEITNTVDDLSVGVTTISGGTNGRVLYDNAGVLGELDLASTYVPLTRTLTINGTTQDLSADRTFTISTGITIGTTAITSGTVGRVLFEGTGNVVQQSANLFWDNTNGRLGIGTSSPTNSFELASTSASPFKVATTQSYFRATFANSGYSGILDFVSSVFSFPTNDVIFGASSSAGGRVYIKGAAATSATLAFLVQNSASTDLFRIWNDGAIGVNTATNAGFKFDVNGTARVQSGLIVQGLTIGRGGGNANSVAIGLEAAPLTTATQNCAVGYRALFNNTGCDNTAVGAFYAMFANTTGTRNTGIGAYALNGNTTGQYNTAIGYNTSSGNFSNSTILGYGAAATASNQFVVGSSGVNAGTVTSEVNASTQVWNVIINGVARKILLA